MIEIGSYKLMSIETGEFALDGGAMFGIIPKPLWEKRIGVDERNRIDMRLRALLVQGNGKNILVDTGIGDKGDAKFNDIYRVDHSRFTLESSLAGYDLKPSDITDVVISHLHFDHAGGATRSSVPAFPNATYYIQKRQYDWALKTTEKERTSFRREDFVPLVEKGVARLIDGPSELGPGVSISVSSGHTEYQQHLFVTDGKQAFFHCADMIPTSVHVGLQWIMGYDVRPLETLEEKRKVLAEASEKGWILFFEHCPHMAAARVCFKDGRYEVMERVDV